MRSPAPASRRFRPTGFSLIEVIITLSLVVLLMSLGFGSMSTLMHTRALQEPMAKVREFAKRARTLAVLEQRPYMVQIHPHGVALFSAIAGPGLLPTPEGGPPPNLVDSFEWDSDVVMRVQRWRMTEFAEPSVQAWIFDRSGLCEPLVVRVDSEFGFIEMSFNPLDAHVEDIVSEIR